MNDLFIKVHCLLILTFCVLVYLLRRKFINGSVSHSDYYEQYCELWTTPMDKETNNEDDIV